jgi:hypothetical protein
LLELLRNLIIGSYTTLLKNRDGRFIGPHTLKTFRVWTEEVEPDVLAGLTRRIA